jgi:hypothetical protein
MVKIEAGDPDAANFLSIAMMPPALSFGFFPA